MTDKSELKEISEPEKLPANPLVSVHMITYNHEEFISQAIEGIASQQTNFDFELLIGEDCSKDGTREKILECQKKYPHLVRVLYSEGNVGQNLNFKRVYEQCRGKYIALCEGDDVWTDVTKLQKQIDFLENNPDYAGAYHDFIVCYDGVVDEKNSSKGTLKDCDSRGMILGWAAFHHSTLCFRNVLGELPEEFHLVRGGDLFLRSLVGVHGKGKYLADIGPNYYNIHSGGTWSGLNKSQQVIKHVETCLWIASYYKSQGRLDAATHFACDAMTRIVQELVLKKSIFYRWELKKSFGWLHGLYKKIKGSG